MIRNRQFPYKVIKNEKHLVKNGIIQQKSAIMRNLIKCAEQQTSKIYKPHQKSSNDRYKNLRWFSKSSKNYVALINRKYATRNTQVHCRVSTLQLKGSPFLLVFTKGTKNWVKTAQSLGQCRMSRCLKDFHNTYTYLSHTGKMSMPQWWEFRVLFYNRLFSLCSDLAQNICCVKSANGKAWSERSNTSLAPGLRKNFPNPLKTEVSLIHHWFFGGINFFYIN